MKKIPLFLIFGLLLCLTQGVSAQQMRPRIKKPQRVETPATPAPKISLIATNIKFQELARLISSTTGIRIVASPTAANTEITVYLPNIDPMEGLAAICRSYNLWIKEDGPTQIIHVQTLAEFRQSIHVVNQDEVEVIPIMYPNAQDMGDAIGQLFTDRVVWSRPDEMNGSYQKISSALSRMDLMGQRGTLEDISGSTGSGSGTTRGGVSVVGIGYGNNGSYGSSYGGSYGGGYGNRYGNQNEDASSLYQYQKTLSETVAQELEKMQWERLKSLDKAIDNSGKTTSSNINENPGVVYISVFGDNNSLMIRSADPQAVKQIKEIVQKLDRPSPQVLLEVKVLSVRVDDTNERSLDFLFKNNNISTGYSVAPSFIPNAVSGGAGESRAATFSAVSDNFEIMLKLIKTDDHSTTLATPTLIVSDNEASNLFSGTEATILEKAESQTTLIAGSETGAVSWAITAPRRKIGTSLVFTPKIHADRSVTIRLLQEQSQVGKQRSIVYSSKTADSDLSQSFLSQDIDYRSITTTVVVQDKQLAMIGGLISEGISVKREKIPFLCDIPVLGEYLFTRVGEERTRDELIVIIRPYVLLAPGENEEITRPMMERLSQHPSAVGDIPELGVTYPEEIAKPRKINPNDPWLIRNYRRLQGWGPDTVTNPKINQAAKDFENKERDYEAEEEIKVIREMPIPEQQESLEEKK